jgi:glycosyltransferase involved in cell wall biosynthesis
VLRLDGETSWAQAAEAGRQLAGAPLVLFLSAACQVGFQAIDRARVRLEADGGIGAVGGMILQAHGVIAQAGGIVWQDGRTHDYMAGESALAPEANFIRAVDFCAPACLLVRTEVLNRLDGFDQGCAPGHEMVDLCLRIGAAGLRVVYDPSVAVTETLPGVRAQGLCPHVLAKHANLLSAHAPAGGPSIQVHARHAERGPRRILFIEDTVPLRRIGSGFVRSNDIVRAMAELGASVTVYPVNGCEHPIARVYGDMPDTVEVMHTLSLEGFGGFLRNRQEYYDLIWVARAHNLQKLCPELVKIYGADLAGVRIVLDTEALTPLRDAQAAELAGRTFDAEAEMVSLQALARRCAATVAVTAEEASVLRRHGLGEVFTIGHALEARPSARPFGQRGGMLFVGAIHTADSPNLDSLAWFTAEVLPLIEAELGWQTRLTIAGYMAPGIDMGRFDGHPRITLRGALADLEPLYNAHRVFVAPTRYAAGAPYKVLEAASRGLPVVCTDILQKQVGWVPGQEIVAASGSDPGGFAAAVLALYRDEALWCTVREGALQRLRREHDRDDFVRSVGAVLAAVAA